MHPRTKILATKPALAAVVVVAGVLAGCSAPSVEGRASRASAPPAMEAPASGDHALHNVHHLGEKIISGAVPDGDAAFDELAAMGVKTIISVDGAMPDLARARARGMRYVHIPITYAEITPEQRLEIARAIRDLPGPIYLHCHHGKHRGPAAAAAAAVTLGMMSAAEGVQFMRTAGTAASYEGLYACVMGAGGASEAALDAAPAEFPELRRAEGMVAAMVEVERAWGHLGDIRAAGWKVPAVHPDLVPAAEAGRLADNFRFAAEDEKARDLGEDHMRRLFEAVKLASALEEGIIRAETPAALDQRFKMIEASCRSCHAEYRNVRPR